MRTGATIETDIVLLGAGHAHVEALRRFARHPLPGARLTLIGREAHTPYSGMLPGLLRGEYGFDEAHIDLAPLAAAAGARLILREADGIDIAGRAVRFAGRPALPYDILSINVGGVPAMPEGMTATPEGTGLPVKPIARFLDRLAGLEARLAPGARIAVVGGGAGGVELALALAARFAGRARLALVCNDVAPLPGAPPRARALARAALAEAGVETLFGVAALRREDGRLVLSDGSAIDVTEVLWATGAVAPPLLAASGLACDARGCVRVGADLRSVSDPRVFAAGDCATLEGNALPKAGVWSVRAGPVLAENLRRAAAGRTLRRWRPQRHALAILGTGGGRAIAWRPGPWGFAFSGRLAWRWKDRIDRRFMAMYSGAMRPADEPARCGGCGAKVGAETLTAALADLSAAPNRHLLIGLDEAEDAAALLPPPGQAVVQSVDHFRSFIDDPFVFGEIAAAHALSDLHAMGARPWTALAIAAVPFMRADKMRADLAAMMQGAAGVLAADGCTLVGGHSAEGAEAALGFAVTGLCPPDALWRKSALRPGDALILTKPLGTGIVLAGQMQGRTRARWLQAAIASMRRSNAAAAAILRAHGVRACTDVTGFGLAGHLLEMLRASGLSAILDPASIPVLPGAAELAAAGVASTLAPANLAAALAALPAGTAPAALALLVDPQTSGGLLAGLAAAQARACVAALRAAGVEAAIVGHVTSPGATPLALDS
jgi:selenide,water dikinase